MDLPPSLTMALEHDRDLALRHGVQFNVVSRRTGSQPRIGLPDRHGTFDQPADAVAIGRSLTDRDVTVLADGSGPYWHSSAPDEVNSQLLDVVCRDKILGPEEARREHRRDHLRRTIERHRADLVFLEASSVVSNCRTEREAQLQLETAPLALSPLQASHLLLNRKLRLLTAEGRRGIEAELDAASQELERLGPSTDVDGDIDPR